MREDDNGRTWTAWRRAVPLAVALALPLAAGPAPAAEGDTAEADDEADAGPEAAGVDLSEWRCEECPFERGWSPSVTLGVGYVSDDSFEFGDFTGLEDEGPYAIAGTEVRYRADDGTYWNLRGKDLGLESRSVSTEGGRQGRYRLYLEYDEVPHFVHDDARTVFSGAGSENLTLPPGWVTGGTTDAMSELAPSLRGVELEEKRETLGVGLEVLQGDHWQHDVSYRRIVQEGTRSRGGNFLLRSSVLPVPVDYVTDQLDVSLAYAEERWQMQLAYHGSFFGNDNESVTWDNPFTPLAPGGDRGRRALAPDNTFHQVMVSGSWRPISRTVASGRVAYGRMEQDEDFLPSTVNTSLASPATPRNDLAGRVDTLAADLRVTTSPLPKLSAQAELYYDDRDNKTPRDAYVQVPSDLFVAAAETNRPYSFEKVGGKLDLDYDLLRRLTVAGGASWEQLERTFQEVEDTETTTVWAELQATPTDRTDVRLRQTREDRERDGSYEPLGLAPPENPLLRKFNLADRVRDATRLRIAYTPTDRTNLGFTADYADDDYEESQIGLTAAKQASFTVDLSATPSDNVTTYTFFSFERIESDISGSDGFSDPNWSATQEDEIYTAGIGTEVKELIASVDAGADLTYSRAHGDIEMEKAGSFPPFPDLKTRLYSLRLFAKYRYNKRTDLRWDYWVERYRPDDFFVDDVAPDTIPSVLTLGQGAPDYTVHVVGVSVRYRF